MNEGIETGQSEKDLTNKARDTSASIRLVTLSPCHLVTLSLPRAWFYLILLSWQRQARARLTVWFALALLVLSMTIVGLQTARGRWSMDHWRAPRGVGPTFPEVIDCWTVTASTGAASPLAVGINDASLAAFRAVLDQSGFLVFSRFFVFSIFVTFLLPIWSLSFATEAMGSERDSRGLVWLLSRPLPRSAIYLAKFLALLPWSLTLTVGGFGLLCLSAGDAGALAFRLYWPAVIHATLAFSSLFYLMGALFRWSAIVAMVYTFFLEVILGNMPGYMKRISIGFYTRCMMFDAAESYGVHPPEKAGVYLPVASTTAQVILLTATVVLVGVGMAIFAHREYQDEV
ncbi:MAG: ABC transporter permease [Gemmataceae bacterium]|nr:ABC transporter permease [Gemmataceae bacterium]